ncbi:flippase [Coprococcus sp. B2-R-112]|uniref:flippase n=1 Tax=Coprococcus sp. B2-R-112 TaxID=2949662 RepID=UPI00202F3FD5|nr:flippase [Coprococcus sp. B2-R-112]MCM0662974.1 flippase [Coprococcus sp. B2-R-112]
MQQKSLKLNFIMNAILTMSSFLFPLITFPYVSRILLPIGTGKVSFANSVVTYFVMISQLGIPTYGIRACAIVRNDEEKLKKTVYELFLINVVMSILAYIVFFVALIYVPRLRADRTLFLITGTLIFFNTIGVEWLYKALEQYTYITVRSIIFKFIALIAMFVLVHDVDDYVIYGGISIFAASASNAFNFIRLRKIIGKKKVSQLNFKQHFKPVFTFFIISCATTIYTNLDNVMLGFMKDDVEVGYYNAATKIKNILVSIVTSLGTVLMPRASYYLQNGMEDEFYKLSKKAIKFVFLAATSMMIYFMLFAREGVLFLSGEAFEGAILPMMIVMPTLLFIGLTNIMGIQMLVPMGREDAVMISTFVGAIVDLILNAIAIPILGASGAAIGTLVAEFVVLIVQLIYLRKDVAFLYNGQSYLKLLIALIAAFIAGCAVKLLISGIFIKLVISAMLFFGVYALILYILKEEIVTENVNKVIQMIKSHIK